MLTMGGRCTPLEMNLCAWAWDHERKRGDSLTSIKTIRYVVAALRLLQCPTKDRIEQLCPTYPARMVVPTKISDATLQYAAKYRSKGRIPVLAYLHWANYVSPVYPRFRSPHDTGAVLLGKHYTMQPTISGILAESLNPG